MAFAHLHVHSSYSHLQAIPSPKQLAEALGRTGAPGAALTDAANLSGFVEWFDAVEKKKLRPVAGAELWTREEPRAEHDPSSPLPGHQLVVLALDLTGWKNLCRIVSLAHRQMNFAPRIGVEQLVEYRQGIVVLTGAQWGCLRDPETALRRTRDLASAVGSERLWVELCDTGLEEDAGRNELGRSIARELSLPVVATNDVRYVEPEDCALLEVTYRISLGSPPDGAWVKTDQAWLKTESEMAELFGADELAESVRILEMASFSPVRGRPMLPVVGSGDGIGKDKAWREASVAFPPPTVFPQAPLLPPEGDGTAVDKWFSWYARAGLNVRLQECPEALQFGSRGEYEDRLELEIRVITGMEYATYHLIVAEFINWSKDNGIAVGPGRGSAAGSLACWAMRITDCNPLQFGLLFERFLNPERRGLPDIDVDFEQGRREEVVAHVREKYGEDRVGQILTIGRMKGRAALKDAARACDVNYQEYDRWSDFVPDGPKAKLKDAFSDPKFCAMNDGNPLFHRVVELAKRLEGQPRQFGIHAAGVVVASDPLEDFCPLHGGVVGLDMKSAESIGLVKFDFLGLKTLDVIQKAVRNVEKRTGRAPRTEDPLFDDPLVYQLLAAPDTLGMFQVESGGMIRLLRRLRPDNFEDLVAVLALFRPGPLQSGMVDDYIECKHGRQQVAYIHPELEGVTRVTHGILVYQEQVMSAARVLAGFSYGEADLLRRAMGKKLPEEMAKQKKFFVDGCSSRGIPIDESSRIFQLIDHFSGYGFNRSHSATYAIISYQTARLKAHYRADFMAAAMSFETHDHNRLRDYITDTRRANIRVLPPDVNLSDVDFTVQDEPPAIRYGLRGVKGLGDAGLAAIISARKQGSYESLEDLAERTSLNKSTLEALVWSGAMDAIEPDRHDAWWRITRPKQKKLGRKQAATQLGLFTGVTAQEELQAQNEKLDSELRPQPPSFAERMQREHEALGCVLSDHPLSRFRDVVPRVRTHTMESAKLARNGSPLVITGHIESLVRVKGKKKDDEPYARFLVEDGDGSIEVVIRGKSLVKADKEGVLHNGACLKVEGTLDARAEDARVVATGLESLTTVRGRASTLLELDLDPRDLASAEVIRDILTEKVDPDGNWIRIRYSGEDGRVRLADLKTRVKLDGEALERIERVTGKPMAIHLPGEAQ